MALKTIEANKIIYNKGLPVDEIALVIKGQVQMAIGKDYIPFEAGSIIGICEPFGDTHRFTYIAKDDVTLYTYPYGSQADIVSLIHDNRKLAPTITLSIVRNAARIYKMCTDIHDLAQKEYDKVMTDLKEYPMLCAKTGSNAKNFSGLSALLTPDFTPEITPWKADGIKVFSSHEQTLSSTYALGAEACTGFVMQAVDFLREVTADIEKILHSLELFHKKTLGFRTEINILTNEANAILSGEEEQKMPSMENSLEQILLYSGYDEEKGMDLKRAIDSYSSIDNRSDTNDTLRSLRRSIASHYYEVYKLVLKKSVSEKRIPAVISMFLNFGYIDERLVTEEDLHTLFGFSCAIMYDGGKIIPVHEWLKKVYKMEVEPSLNEFQQDYPTYLRECKNNGDISQELMEERLGDPEYRLDFEIKNMFTLGNRMTFGRVTLFSPIFDSQTRMLPLERSRLTPGVLSEEINRVRSIDYSIFYREKIFRMPGNESIQLFVHEEQIPYIIVFPNIGQNLILWQTIEGRVRNSPARIFAPAFFEENITDAITQVCAEYRWEVCKTDQGVRWTDITEPSLTAEYNDFLQFFKKNGSLSKDHKEKIRTQVKKYANNFKKVFVSDYLSYIKFESVGNMRLLKQVREIMFKYCTFSKETRDRMMTSPQYEKLIEIRNNKNEQKIRPIHNLIQKTENSGDTVPDELLSEMKFLEM